jgi:hypothetical protein
MRNVIISENSGLRELNLLFRLFLLLLALPFPAPNSARAQHTAVYHIWLPAVISVGSSSNGDPQLKISIASDLSYVLLENSKIRVRYKPFTEGHAQFAIKEYIVKSAGNQNQIGSAQFLDAATQRGTLRKATLIYDGSDSKTVRLEWNTTSNSGSYFVSEVSIYPHSTYIKIKYIDAVSGVNIVEQAQPGGTTSGTHVAYGGDHWIRGYVTLDYTPTKGSYYNRFPADEVYDPADGGSLNYKGYFIVGVYNNLSTSAYQGLGIGRVVPVKTIEIIKLLFSDSQRVGFELFHFNESTSFNTYLYAVTGGSSEILSMGKTLVDTMP